MAPSVPPWFYGALPREKLRINALGAMDLSRLRVLSWSAPRSLRLRAAILVDCIEKMQARVNCLPKERQDNFFQGGLR